MEDKRKLMGKGYVPPDGEHLDITTLMRTGSELKESFNMDSLDDGPRTRFPTEESVPGFKTYLVELAKVSEKLSRMILQGILLAFGQDPDAICGLYSKPFTDDNYTAMRTLFYPPVKEDVPAGSVRLGQHTGKLMLIVVIVTIMIMLTLTDYGAITLLYQDPMGGLEVLDNQTNSWITVIPEQSSNAILVNVGDLLEVLTNGILPAAWHRVTIPETESVRQICRQSIAFFANFDHDANISPLKNLRNDQQKIYMPVNAKAYLDQKMEDCYTEVIKSHDFN